MKKYAIVLATLALSATLGLVAAKDQPAPASAPVGGEPQEREADIRAITDLLASFVKSYNAGDAKALGGLFTAEALIEDDDGEVTQGRDSIVKRFTSKFAGKDRGTLALDTESLRFFGKDLAVEEGKATLTSGPDGTPSSNRYTVIYAREDGRWLHARIRDEPEVEVPAREHLQALEWMLGEWVNESDDEVVYTTCKWSDNGNFLVRQFDVKIEGSIALTGTQRIGWDAQRGQFRMWVFDDRGGFAEGLLSSDGGSWFVKGTGVRSDGQSVSFTNAITPLDKDRIRWEILERTVGGKTTRNFDQFELVRRAPQPGNE